MKKGSNGSKTFKGSKGGSGQEKKKPQPTDNLKLGKGTTQNVTKLDVKETGFATWGAIGAFGYGRRFYHAPTMTRLLIAMANVSAVFGMTRFVDENTGKISAKVTAAFGVLGVKRHEDTNKLIYPPDTPQHIIDIYNKFEELDDWNLENRPTPQKRMGHDLTYVRIVRSSGGYLKDIPTSEENQLIHCTLSSDTDEDEEGLCHPWTDFRDVNGGNKSYRWGKIWNKTRNIRGHVFACISREFCNTTHKSNIQIHVNRMDVLEWGTEPGETSKHVQINNLDELGLDYGDVDVKEIMNKPTVVLDDDEEEGMKEEQAETDEEEVPRSLKRSRQEDDVPSGGGKKKKGGFKILSGNGSDGGDDDGANDAIADFLT